MGQQHRVRSETETSPRLFGQEKGRSESEAPRHVQAEGCEKSDRRFRGSVERLFLGGAMDAASHRYLIVDGHSVIFAWPDLRRLHQRRTALARDELVKRLRDYQDWTGIHVVVVFDGKGTDVTNLSDPHDIQIFYSRAGQTADSIVERLAGKYAERFSAHDRHVGQSRARNGSGFRRGMHLSRNAEAAFKQRALDLTNLPFQAAPNKAAGSGRRNFRRRACCWQVARTRARTE